MKNKYINLSIFIPEEHKELVFANIFDLDFCGIEEQFDKIIITFDEKLYSEDLKNDILQRIKSVYQKAYIINEIRIDEINWNEEWEKNVPIIEVNDQIVIAPSWKIDDTKHPIKIIIDPKMSFGTGEHPTTRLCCDLLSKKLEKNEFWVDVGTGSGVLAILAHKLGAERVLAFDNNIWSIENAEENFKLNFVEDKIDLLEADIDNYTIPECDGIIANIFLHLANVGFPIFHKSLIKSKGKLILSGILVYDKEIVIEEAIKNGFELIETQIEQEWIAFYFKAI